MCLCSPAGPRCVSQHGDCTPEPQYLWEKWIPSMSGRRFWELNFGARTFVDPEKLGERGSYRFRVALALPQTPGANWLLASSLLKPPLFPWPGVSLSLHLFQHLTSILGVTWSPCTHGPSRQNITPRGSSSYMNWLLELSCIHIISVWLKKNLGWLTVSHVLVWKVPG